MEKYIIFGASTIIIVTLMILGRHWLDKRANKKPLKENTSNTVRQPILYRYVGIGGIIIFLALGLFFLLAPESMISDFEDGMRVPVFFIFLAICIPYVFIIMLQINWKIEIGDSEFSFRNIWGKKRTYHYDDVKVKQLSRCTRFYHNEKHIVGISILQENWEALQKSITAYKKELKKQRNN